MELKVLLPESFPRELAIIMPVYNEEKSLALVIHEWKELIQSFHGVLVFINDGSKDDSLLILQKYFSSSENNYLVIIDKVNSGHGPSCLVGYNWAIKENFS